MPKAPPKALDDSPTIETRIGLEVKRMRERAGLSLRAFADRAGFSPSFISQLENGQVSPSIASLEKIAAQLNMTVKDFFAASSGHDTPVIRAAERPTFRSSWSKAQVAALTSMGTGHALEALMVTLEPGGESAKHPSPTRYDQFAIVFSGTLELTLGDETLVLAAGDAVQIAAGLGHRWVNRQRRAAQVVLVSRRLD
jgi:quercetin dioxygenase-like cupin family protein